MSKKKKKHKGNGEAAKEEFSLHAPSGRIPESQDESADVETTIAGAVPRPKSAATAAEEREKQFSWKGFEEQPEEVDPDPAVSFTKPYEEEEEGMDMTPMVDVTFLLLIFFMVTASFALQKSIPQPPPNINDPSTNVIEEPEDEKDYVEVIIDQENRFYVTTRSEDEEETPSETQMRSKIRNAKLDYGAERLIITAHLDSTHERVITVWDAGLAAGYDRIELRTTETEY